MRKSVKLNQRIVGKCSPSKVIAATTRVTSNTPAVKRLARRLATNPPVRLGGCSATSVPSPCGYCAYSWRTCSASSPGTRNTCSPASSETRQGTCRRRNRARKPLRSSDIGRRNASTATKVSLLSLHVDPDELRRIEAGFLVEPVGHQLVVFHCAVIQTSEIVADRTGSASTPVMPDEQQRLVGTVEEQATLLPLRKRHPCRLLRQAARLEHHITVGGWIGFPEFGAEEGPHEAFFAGHGQPVGQRHVGAAQQSIQCLAGEPAVDARLPDECRIEAAVLQARAQPVDDRAVPAGMHHAKPVVLQ